MEEKISERIKIITEGGESVVYLDGKRKASYRGSRHKERAKDVATGMQYGLGAKPKPDN